jgi:hypothetical protein
MYVIVKSALAHWPFGAWDIYNVMCELVGPVKPPDILPLLVWLA